MRYALLVYNKPDRYDGMSDEQRQAVFDEYDAIGKAACVVGRTRLKDVEAATTVRVKDGQTLVTDGPFADTKEVFGGLFLVDADNLDGALEIAARIPAARLGGSVEVRPVLE